VPTRVNPAWRLVAPGVFLAFALCLGTGCACAQARDGQDEVARGAYLAKAGGCVACHTEDRKGATPYAGGRALKTPFGIFYGPNITPDPQAGIGRWSEADFARAMREGVRPDGANLFPAFPYPSFTNITDSDLKALWAYLRTLPPSSKASRKHDLRAPFGWRWLVTPWKWLYFRPGPFKPDPAASQAVNRGAYLVRALGHCGECHTPRNWLGGPRRDRMLAGGTGPDGKGVPNITPTKLKKWSDADLKEFLTTAITPDGDIANKTMSEVVNDTTSQLTPGDRDALIAYLRSLPAIPDEPKSK
jgi:mono/diheme cytochrome c family protein